MNIDKEIIAFIKTVKDDYENLAEPYKMFDRDPDRSIVRLLRYKKEQPKISGPVNTLLLPNEKGRFVDKDKSGVGLRILPLVLILRAGESAMVGEKQIRDGEIRMVPSSMTVGMTRNPDYVDVHDAHIKQGTVTSSGIPEFLPTNVVYWGRHRFFHPFSELAKELSMEDMYTFNIPPSFILQSVNL